MSFYAGLDSFRNWDGFRLEHAKIVGSTNIFGIAEFISTLALLVVIVSLSDFRYRYRFAVQRLNVRTLGTWVAATIGALLLLTEFWFLAGTYKLKGASGDYWKTPEYQRLEITVRFVGDAISSLEKHAIRPNRLRRKEPRYYDTFDALADLIFEIVFAVSYVSEPDWTCWSIQHNSVWSTLFTFNSSEASSIILFKLRRLIYDEIKAMDKFTYFKGAGFLGYCLNVLGLTLVDRHTGYSRVNYPLHAAVLNWTKKNYRRLVVDHPKVAERCLQGAVAYDRDNHRLVKTFANDTRKEPVCVFLNLD